MLYRLDYGGLENGVVNLINRLPPDEFSHVVIALTDATDFKNRLRDDVEIIQIHKPPGNSPGYLFDIWKILKRCRFDILHTRNLPCLETQLAGFMAGVSVRIHGEHGWDIFDIDGTVRRYRWLRRAMQPIIHRYIVLSRHLQDYLAMAVGIRPERITRICNGVDTARFLPVPDSNPPGTFVVGSVGRIVPVKDYMTLARAFCVLAGSPGERHRLTIIGDGVERTMVATYLASQGLQAVSDLPGSSDDIPELMRQFSVFVLPSRAEGISNTILEAMASGLPVIATDVGGNGELVVEGETGFLVQAGDFTAIAERLAYYRDHPEVLVRHGRAARARVLREFSIDVMVANYRRLYHDCAQAAGLPGATG